ncbi:MAG: glutathione S-transferase family protein [Alphaproteobacteria bacterium]|nr:glutathione S-transferase family protein [Alphaproteobacteria bacterium]
MITLYGFGPAFGLPDPSPFVMKTEVQLQMAGLSYVKQRAAPPTAPKGKIPFIEDKGVRIADSTFIRAHIERKYGVDLDRGLTPDLRARGWAIERMLEDHLYFALLHARWMDDGNFASGPAHFFDALPAETREAARQAGRERVRQTLHGQGLGRHSPDEIAELGGRSLAALSSLLGNKPYLFGPAPCAADATAFAFVAGAMTPFFDSKLRTAALTHKNLIAYRERMMEEHYPKFIARKAA